ncbi:MAG: transporter substrate-binding domain-containing protein [Gammaproteobacteria bacterium]|nr:transporter substrate-binding domain-containing protein [Gammaproteobacteria bacterium]MDH5583292.1 transporter substrate-binding domain-containing protein [Gammaproteobacteria bacterium]
MKFASNKVRLFSLVAVGLLASTDLFVALAAEPTEESAVVAEFSSVLPEEFARLWQPWTGDLAGMIERRAIRVVVPFGGYQFYYEQGKPRGAIIEMLRHLETFLNDELERRHVRVHIVPIPMGREHLLTSLLQGNADLIAADLTITAARSGAVTFTRPLLKNINEVVLTGPSSPVLKSIDDLSGREIVVKESSSYYEHLLSLSRRFEEAGKSPPIIVKANEILEAEDLLEMLHAGMIPLTVLDDYKARFWADVFPNLVVRDDLILNQGGEIAWAVRTSSTELSALLERFLRQYGKGTLVGNDIFKRYLSSADRVRCAGNIEAVEKYPELVKPLQAYADMYDFDWLMLASQGFQESGLRQDRRSPAGAVGVMQIKPSTAADKNVGIDSVDDVDNNIHAGAKYLRFLADRYFSDGIDPLNQWFFALAAYNAGPARVASLRDEAAENGYDRNRWFDNVEIIAARRIGAETVGYVSSIYKYYVGYQLARVRRDERREQYGTELTGCQQDPG